MIFKIFKHTGSFKKVVVITNVFTISVVIYLFYDIIFHFLLIYYAHYKGLSIYLSVSHVYTFFMFIFLYYQIILVLN